MSPLIITCPACGFSFRAFDPRTREKKNTCPICGFKLPNDSDKKIH